MRVVVTGGTGFLGTYVLAEALVRNWDVVAIRRSGSQTRVPLVRQPIWLDRQLDQITPSDLEGRDVLIHLAATGVSPQKASWDELYYWNVVSPVRLFLAAENAGIRRYVVCGSYTEYGAAGERYEFIPPDAPLEPQSSYASSKAALSMACRAFCSETGTTLTYLRLFSAYGDGQHESNFWPSLKVAALSGRDFAMTRGEQIRDFIPAEQAAQKYCDAAAWNHLSPGEPHFANVGSGFPIRLRDFAQDWWRKWNAQGRLQIGAIAYRPNEVMRCIPKLT